MKIDMLCACSTHDDQVEEMERLQLSVSLRAVQLHFILLDLRNIVVFILKRTQRTRCLFQRQIQFD